MSSWIPIKKKLKAPSKIRFKFPEFSEYKESQFRISFIITNKKKKLINIDNPPILTIGVLCTFLWFGKSTIRNLFPIYLTKGARK